MSSTDATNFSHQFLIAMPSVQDDTFARSVVYLCEHSERGALGLVINKPTEMSLKRLFEKVDLPLNRADLTHAQVLLGGPVQTERGFVLHDAMSPPAVEGEDESKAEHAYASSLALGGGLEMTTSKDVLEAMSSGAGPKRVLVTLGYAAWGEGQLESEIAENSWLTVDADPAVIFDTPIEQRYDRALGLLGLKGFMLTPDAGHA